MFIAIGSDCYNRNPCQYRYDSNHDSHRNEQTTPYDMHITHLVYIWILLVMIISVHK